MKDKEMELYQRMCVGCEHERYCHKECVVCEEYQEQLDLLEMRTEQDILDEFEILGYKVEVNDEKELVLSHSNFYQLKVNKQAQGYLAVNRFNNRNGIMFDLAEHKLLNELFIIWGWL